MPCVGLVLFMWCFQPTVPAASVATFCGVAKPIRMSHRDTRRTKEQVDSLNKKGVSLCRWK